jgi:hypothetical protein
MNAKSLQLKCIPNTNHIACGLNNSMSSTSSALFAYMNLPPGWQGTIGSNKSDVKLAKHLVFARS